MSDTIFKDEELTVERFHCDCKSPGHSLDVELMKFTNGEYSCSFNLFMVGEAPLGFRLKEAWKLLRGRDAALEDFCFPIEDVPRLIALLSTLVTSPHTATSGTFLDLGTNEI